MTAPEVNGELISPSTRRTLAIVAAAALVLTLLGWFLDRDRAAAGILVAAQYAIGISLGGLLFVVLGYVTKAGWSTAIRRVPEAMAATLPVTGAIAFVGVLFALPIYEWAHPDAVAGDALLEHKSAWLNVPGVLIRAVLFVGIWTLFARALRRASLRQDRTGDVQETHKSVYLSCGFLAAFAITWPLASVDWVMSLEPLWFSTIYAIYTFTSFFLSGLAVIVIALILLKRAGRLRSTLRADHLHDLGKLMFGFSTFWAYIWFCQYMLIWYSDIPEETTYYVSRMGGTWGPLMMLNVVITWLLPFLILLPRSAKRSESVMLKVSILLLFARWLDLHLLVMPGVLPDAPYAFWWELLALVGFLSIVVLVGTKAFAKAPETPRQDPYFEESLHHHA